MLPRRPVHSDFSIPSTISPDSGRGIFHTRSIVILHKTETYFLHLLFKKYFKKLLTFSTCCGIIIKSSGSNTPARQSGCGAAGSALPWGGRGRKFKSCHSDQNRRFYRTSDFSLFYGLFRDFVLFTAVHTASKTSAIFLPKIGSKSGTTTCLTTFVTKKLYSIRVFGTLRFLIYAK